MKKYIIITAFIIFYIGNKTNVEPLKIPFSYWDAQKKGTNFFNERPLQERFYAAKKLGLDFIRLTPSKWKSVDNPVLGNFLLGETNNYTALNPKDIEVLNSVLNMAQKADIKVILTFLNLPGRRWRQHNNEVQEQKIWQDNTLQDKAIKFISDVAETFGAHQALVGINPINEPAPELVEPKMQDWYLGDYEAWYEKIKGSTQDLNLFYEKLVKKVREKHASLPIFLDLGFYATPWAIKIMKPIDDNNVLYSFHMYEPFEYTFSHKQKHPKNYPGFALIGENNQYSPKKYWDKQAIKEFFIPIKEWQTKFSIPNNRIFVGEFGVNRTAPGAAQYFSDLINIFDDYNWHWAFYSFREDNWDKMDYELGSGSAGYKYWQSINKQEMPEYTDKQRCNDFIKPIIMSIGVSAGAAPCGS